MASFTQQISYNITMTSLDLEIIVQAFAHYNLGTIQGMPLQIKGDIDLNYKIQTSTNSYLLKYIVDPSTLKHFELLGSLHQYLIKKEIKVPLIYPTKMGGYVHNSFILYEFKEGTAQKEWSRDEMISLTEEFTKMLVAMRSHHVPNFIKNKDDTFVRGGNIHYCLTVFRPRIHELPCPEDIRTDIILIIETLHQQYSDFESLPKFLIDGDLNETNALFKNNQCTAIIDLSLSYEPVVYALGVMCYWFAFPWWTTEFNRERYELIQKIFLTIIPLSPLEKKLLPYMVMRRSMMDIMTTLQKFWSETARVPFPEQRLRDQIRRNSEIMNIV